MQFPWHLIDYTQLFNILSSNLLIVYSIIVDIDECRCLSSLIIFHLLDHLQQLLSTVYHNSQIKVVVGNVFVTFGEIASQKLIIWMYIGYQYF